MAEAIRAALARVDTATLAPETGIEPQQAPLIPPQDLPPSPEEREKQTVPNDHPFVPDQAYEPSPSEEAASSSGAGESARNAAQSDATSDDTAAPSASFQEELDSLLGPPQPPPPASAAETEPAPVGMTVEEFMKLGQVAPQRKRNSFYTSYIVAGLIVVGAAAYLITSSGSPDKQGQQQQPSPRSGERTAQSAAPSEAKPSAGSGAGSPTSALATPALPSFIPPDSRVRGENAAASGWEKYLTPETEFRVHRENSSIKAIQAIDRTGKGISRGRFTSIIHEVGGVRDYRLESKEKKGDLLVKKGSLSSNSKVIIYKRNNDTLIQAFVIYFP